MNAKSKAGAFTVQSYCTAGRDWLQNHDSLFVNVDAEYREVLQFQSPWEVVSVKVPNTLWHAKWNFVEKLLDIWFVGDVLQNDGWRRDSDNRAFGTRTDCIFDMPGWLVNEVN